MFSKTELLREKVQIEGQYREALAVADQFKRAVDGIDALLALQNAKEVVSVPLADTEPSSGPMTTRIIGIIESFPQEKTFSLRDVLNHLDKDASAKSISTILRNLKEAKIVEVVTAGIGRRPAIYKRSASLANREAA